MEQRCRFYCYRKTRKQNHYKTIKTDKIKLIIFDMDGVLTDIVSSWKYIHNHFNTSNERSVNDYLKGKTSLLINSTTSFNLLSTLD